MPVPSSSGDFPAVSAPKFYGGGPPRPYLYKDAKLSKEKVDPPSPVADSFLSWAREAQLTMSSLRFDRRRTQGSIDGSIRRLREDEEGEEEEEERGNQKKRPKMETIDSGESEESDDVDSSEEEEEEEEAEKAPDSDESQNSSDSEEEEEEEVDEAEDTTDSEESEESKDREEEEGEEQDIEGKQPVGCRRSKRLKGRW